MTPGLLDEVRLAGRTLPSRVLFGPHVTNLAVGRSIGDRHVAYYERRARGGCGAIVTEVASVHPSDWPYERAPLAAACAGGWRSAAEACGPHGTVLLAGLGHAGMQGSTSWTQDVLWAPSLVPSVSTREQPLALGSDELVELRESFVDAARIAVDAGCDGVELNAGQHSLLRQFCSGLTNLRDDRYGEDRALLLAEVVAAVRAALGDAVVGLRFCADELAPWAGITPGDAETLLERVAVGVDYVCVVRGSIYSEAATQPDGHEPQAFNDDVTVQMHDALRAAALPALVCAQGSIVDAEVAERLVHAGSCELVEMTRALIADPDLVAKVRAGDADRVRPCLLCNQHCLVRDVRNPLVSCCVNPVAGHELDDAELDDAASPPAPDQPRRTVLVVGGGVAGLEAARVAARLGARVTVRERAAELGGALRAATRLPGHDRLALLVEWLRAELAREGVGLELDRPVVLDDLAEFDAVVVASGALGPVLELRDGNDGSVAVVSAATVAEGGDVRGPVVVVDPIGGPIGVGVAELLAARGASVTVVTPDVVVGSQLSLTGDLVAANARLAAISVTTRCHAVPVGIEAGAVLVEDRFTAEMTRLTAATCVDAGHLRAADAWWDGSAIAVGDAVAPRGILMAMLEARRAAVAIAGRAP